MSFYKKEWIGNLDDGWTNDLLAESCLYFSGGCITIFLSHDFCYLKNKVELDKFENRKPMIENSNYVFVYKES